MMDLSARKFAMVNLKKKKKKRMMNEEIEPEVLLMKTEVKTSTMPQCHSC